MHYRLYKSEDFAALYAIEESCFQPPLRFSRAYMRRLVGLRDTVTWIAEEHGSMRGFAIVDWKREGARRVAYVQTLEVRADCRGRGTGKELLHRLERSARAARCDLIWLHVDEENEAAIRLYEVEGYLARGREEGYYGRGHAAIIYAKALPVMGGVEAGF